jgi:hypothetical protein
VTAVGEHPLYRSPWTASVREMVLHPGSVAWLGEVPLLALDERMVSLRPRLAWSMGLDAAGPVDAALVAVADRAPLLILGPHTLDDDAILAALDGAAVCIDLDEPRALPAPHAARVFAPRRDARVVLRATKENRARSVLDTYASRVSVLRLVPLASRPGEISRLLAAMWRDLGTSARVDALGARALRGLAAYRWPGNLTELRAHAPRLLAYHQRGGLRAAARSLGVTHHTLAGHFRRIGMPIIDQADREGGAGADRDSDPLTAKYLLIVLSRAKPGPRAQDQARQGQPKWDPR